MHPIHPSIQASNPHSLNPHTSSHLELHLHLHLHLHTHTELWTTWINDEIRLASKPIQKQAILGVYELALSDYLCIPLYLEYLSYCTSILLPPLPEEEDEDEDDNDNEEAEKKKKADRLAAAAAAALPLDDLVQKIEIVRHAHEKAVASAGLHLTEGKDLWEAYRQFEMECLQRLEAFAPPGSNHSSTDADADAKTNDTTHHDDSNDTDTDAGASTEKKPTPAMIEAQKARIRKVFTRQLSIPHKGMDETFSAFMSWERRTTGKELHQRILSAYQKTKTEMEKRLPYEDRLQAAPAPVSPGAVTAEVVGVWYEYIAYETKVSLKRNPMRIQTLYERALAACFLVDQMWVSYASFVQEHIAVPSFLHTVYYRGTRNCPWSGVLWEGLLSTEEERMYRQSDGDNDSGGDLNAVRGSYHRAMAAAMAPGDHAKITLVMIEIIRRHFKVVPLHFRKFDKKKKKAEREGTGKEKGAGTAHAGADSDSDDDDDSDDEDDGMMMGIEWMKQLFASTSQHVGQLIASLAEHRVLGEEHVHHTNICYDFYSYWTLLEGQFANNTAKARMIWHQFLESKVGQHELRAWKALVALEYECGDAAQVRAMYRRSVAKLPNDWRTEEMCKAWVHFEQQHGTVADLQAARKRVAKRLEETKKTQTRLYSQMQQQTQADAQAAALEEEQRQVAHQRKQLALLIAKEEKKQAGLSKHREKIEADKSLKRKRESAANVYMADDGTGLSYKKRKAAMASKGPESSTSAVSSAVSATTVAPTAVDRGAKGADTDTDTVMADAPVSASSATTATTAVASSIDSNAKTTSTNERTTKKSKKELQKLKDSRKDNPNVAFVLNVGWDTSEDDLTKHFEGCGAIREVRHIRNYKGFSKGFAYVEFDSKACVAEAVKTLDGVKLKGRVLQVKYSTSKNNRKEKNTGQPDPTSVFIKNLPVGSVQDLKAMLRARFEQCGNVMEVRLAMTNAGVCKGFGYVEFEAPGAVEDALKMDGSRVSVTNVDQSSGKDGDSKADEDGNAAGDATTNSDNSSIITVKRNFPPKKKEKGKKGARGGKRGRGETREAGRSKVRLFIPRAMRQKKSNNNNDASADTDDATHSKKDEPQKSLSNADFRAMLMSKKKK